MNENIEFEKKIIDFNQYVSDLDSYIAKLLQNASYKQLILLQFHSYILINAFQYLKRNSTTLRLSVESFFYVYFGMLNIYPNNPGYI